MSRHAGRFAEKPKRPKIFVKVDLDGTGKASISTGIGFFRPYVDQIARHGLIDLTVQCEGDLEVDGHHSVEDVGIALGQAIGRSWR